MANASTRTRNGRNGGGRTQQQSGTKAQPPVAQETFGLVKAVVWGNETESGTMYSVQFSRLFKRNPDDTNWEESPSFNQGNLLDLGEASRWAYHEIRAIRAEQNQQ